MTINEAIAALGELKKSSEHFAGRALMKEKAERAVLAVAALSMGMDALADRASLEADLKEAVDALAGLVTSFFPTWHTLSDVQVRDPRWRRAIESLVKHKGVVREGNSYRWATKEGGT